MGNCPAHKGEGGVAGGDPAGIDLHRDRQASAFSAQRHCGRIFTTLFGFADGFLYSRVSLAKLGVKNSGLKQRICGENGLKQAKLLVHAEKSFFIGKKN